MPGFPLPAIQHGNVWVFSNIYIEIQLYSVKLQRLECTSLPSWCCSYEPGQKIRNQFLWWFQWHANQKHEKIDQRILRSASWRPSHILSLQRRADFVHNELTLKISKIQNKICLSPHHPTTMIIIFIKIIKLCNFLRLICLLFPFL